VHSSFTAFRTFAEFTLKASRFVIGYLCSISISATPPHPHWLSNVQSRPRRRVLFFIAVPSMILHSLNFEMNLNSQKFIRRWRPRDLALFV